MGITGFPGIYAYASTKGTIEALSRTLRLEFSPYGIAVTLMHPPLTNTESAAPLGIPARAMADPAVVGRNLAREIHSSSPVVTTNMATSVGLLPSRIFPTTIGSFSPGAQSARGRVSPTRIVPLTGCANRIKRRTE